MLRRALLVTAAGATLSARAMATTALTYSFIPPMSLPHRKGDHGRVAVVGGSFEYTGAPYYAAISALKTGADLAYVICSGQAAVPIKSYSPEPIVLPLLPYEGMPAPSSSSSSSSSAAAASADMESRLVEALGRAHTAVIGPGLGRDAVTLAAVARVIQYLGHTGVPTVLDGDALFLLSQRPQLLHGHPSVVLTPNPVEFDRLLKATGLASSSDSSDSSKAGGAQADPVSQTLALARALAGGSSSSGSGSAGIAILRKGEADVIVGVAGSASLVSNSSALAGIKGSPRRCGGQGDILAGALGTMLHWSKRYDHATTTATRTVAADASTHASSSGSSGGEGSADGGADGSTEDERRVRALVQACEAASGLVRAAAAAAYAQHRRGTTTPDIIAAVPRAFDELFGPSTW